MMMYSDIMWASSTLGQQGFSERIMNDDNGNVKQETTAIEYLNRAVIQVLFVFLRLIIIFVTFIILLRCRCQ